MDISALYSKDRVERRAVMDAFIAGSSGMVIHLYPKNLGTPPAHSGVYSVTYEALTDRAPWLHVNSMVGPSTSLLLENPARYPVATTPKSRALRRLSMQISRKMIVDFVPFTQSMEALYTPLSYLSRSILGYAHNYVWRENYQEVGEDGVIRDSHDPTVVAQKMASYCRVSYASFLHARQVVECPATAAEHEAYAMRRDELFSKETNPQRIVTRLADTAHAFESRTLALIELVRRLEGPVLVACNLASYAQRAQTATRASGLRNVRVTSYQLGLRDQGEPPAHMVYLESPIVDSYYLLDIEASLPDDCQVWHFRGDTKVDLYLYGQIDAELTAIQALTKELYRVQGQ